jgi:hypothetical protein
MSSGDEHPMVVLTMYVGEPDDEFQHLLVGFLVVKMYPAFTPLVFSEQSGELTPPETFWLKML